LTPEAYGDVFGRPERDRVRYVVIGGVAAVLRGDARSVEDLDFAVYPAAEESGRAPRALGSLVEEPSDDNAEAVKMAVRAAHMQMRFRAFSGPGTRSGRRTSSAATRASGSGASPAARSSPS